MRSVELLISNCLQLWKVRQNSIHHYCRFTSRSKTIKKLLL